jgi:hypothetical protein
MLDTLLEVVLNLFNLKKLYRISKKPHDGRFNQFGETRTAGTIFLNAHKTARQGDDRP